MWASVGRSAARHLRVANAPSRFVNKHTDYIRQLNAVFSLSEDPCSNVPRYYSKETYGDLGEASFGFAPDELDLEHLDQTQANSAAPVYFKQDTRQSNEATLPRAMSQETAPQQLTHLDSHGKAHMVDVGQKDASVRTATASAVVQLNSTAFKAIAADGKVDKGDALTVAQLAGIMGAKQTSQLIPLCHNIPLDKVNVELTLDSVKQCVRIEAMAKTQAYTGVEMEAMVAASVAALTVYDMCKALDKSITIQNVQLDTKTGGKSGDYHRQLDTDL